MKLSFIALICLCCLQTFAQKFHVSLSESKAGYATYSTLTAPGGELIGIRKEEKNNGGMNWNKYRMTVTLVQYDKDMKVTKENKLSGGDNAYSAFYSSLQLIGNKIWFIYVAPGEKNDIGNIMAIEINPATLETSAPKVLAASDAMGVSVPLFNGMAAKKILFKKSPDQKRYMLLVGAAKEQFYLCTLDEQLNVVWDKKASIPGTAANKIQSAVIDNAGNIFVSYTGGNEDNGTADVMVFKQTGAPIHKVLRLADARPYETLLLLSKKGDSLHIAGTYFDKTDNIGGAFKSSIAIAGFKLSDVRKTPFPATIIERFANDDWGSTKGKRYGLYPQFSSELVETGEGICIVAEFRSMDMNATGIEHVGGILGIYFDGRQTSFFRIPKYRRNAGSSMGDSYYAVSAQGKLIVFYNDSEENLNQDIALKPASSTVYKNVMLVAAIVEPDGALKREKVIDLKDQNFLGIVESMKVLSPSAVQLRVQKVKGLGGAGNEQMLATITID